MRIPIESVLDLADGAPAATEVVGRSREDREIEGISIGHGNFRISLIGGCHADEPVGPAMLRKLVHYLDRLPPSDPLIDRLRWVVVPHVNPDGESRNRGWEETTSPTVDSQGAPDRAYDPISYVESVTRELPGEDIEFGFPRSEDDFEARPENRAVAEFLTSHGPFGLHASFHGMGFAPGPWFLLESGWTDRTVALRQRLRDRVREMGLGLLDIDRQGEKGFHRIDEGFSTRPDSRAMIEHFLARDDRETAALFRPSSMEFVRRLGGDPLTIVSEMPLFLLTPEIDPGADTPKFEPGTTGMRQLHAWLRSQIEENGAEAARKSALRSGVRGMPIRDQMRLQLSFLNEALEAASRDHSL